MEGGGWRVEGGGWRVEGGGWRVEGGGRREGGREGGRAYVSTWMTLNETLFSKLKQNTLLYCSFLFTLKVNYLKCGSLSYTY